MWLSKWFNVGFLATDSRNLQIKSYRCGIGIEVSSISDHMARWVCTTIFMFSQPTRESKEKYDWSHKYPWIRTGHVSFPCDDSFTCGICWKGRFSTCLQAGRLPLHRTLDLAEMSVCFHSGSPCPAAIRGNGFVLRLAHWEEKVEKIHFSKKNWCKLPLQWFPRGVSKWMTRAELIGHTV